MFLAVGIFTVMDSCAKYLTRFYPVPVVVWVRFVASLLVLLAFLATRGQLGLVRTSRPGLQLARGLLLAGATAFFFTSLKVLPLAEASAIGFIMPLFLALLAVPMLGERMDGARLVAIAVGFTGVLLVIRPGSAAFTPYALLPICMAVCNALYQILTRRLAGVEPALTSLVWGSIVGAVLFSFSLPFFWVTPTNPWHWALIGVLGVLASVGHFTLIKAYDYASASGLAPFFYTQFVWILLVGWLVFGEFPDGWSLAGIGVIVASGLFVVGRHRLTVRRKNPSMPKASWNGATLAEADAGKVQHVEGNVYFPPEAVNKALLRESQTHTFCPWKGTASYYDVVVDGKTNKDAAWFYPETKDAANHVKGYVAFWKGVSVEP